jgi:hypothetical protein
MVEPLNLRNLAWALTTLLELALFAYLIRRKLYVSRPAFSSYILVVILQSILMAVAYRFWDPQNHTLFAIAWGSQAVVISARWLAVNEIARKILSGYSAIRKMTSSLLVLLGACVLVYAFAFSGRQLDRLVLNADRAIEMCIAGFIVAMLLFVRYYRLPLPSPERLLAIGFCLYSCFYVINDSVYENCHTILGSLWSFLEVLTFLASLLLWINAIRSSAEPLQARSPVILSPEKYAELSQELNSRLYLLDRRLQHLLRSEGPRS